MDKLHRDILLLIIEYLDINDIINLSFMNKRLLSLCRDDVIWNKIYNNEFNENNINEKDYYNKFVETVLAMKGENEMESLYS